MINIDVYMDSNESQSFRANRLAVATLDRPEFNLCGFKNLPVDLRFEYGDRAYNVELKEVADFWQSKNSCRLGQQVMTMISLGEPGMVVVFGSIDEVVRNVPRMQNDGIVATYRDKDDMQADLNTARAMVADVMACNVPVWFMSYDHDLSFQWLLSHVKHVFQGPNMASWLPRFPVDPTGYCILASIPGIGNVTAIGLLQRYETVMDILEDPNLEEAVINGRKLGASKASKIRRSFGTSSGFGGSGVRGMSETPKFGKNRENEKN